MSGESIFENSGLASEVYPPNEAEVTALVEEWKKGAVFATGSASKLEALKALGFNTASAEAVPDEVEDNYFESMQTPNTDFGSEKTAEFVAQVKVDYLIDEQNISPSALVAAFDTIAVLTYKRDPDVGRRRREYLRKPKTREDAKAMILHTFEHIAAAKMDLDSSIEEYSMRVGDERLVRDVASMLSHGKRQTQLMVATGFAVRLPHEEEIQTHLSMTLQIPQSVYAYAHNDLSESERTERLEALAEDALAIMDEGERWKKVAGGIDLSDPQIIGLLGLEDVQEHVAPDVAVIPDAEQGTFTGVPEKAFVDFLHALARDRLVKQHEKHSGTA